MAKDYIFVSLLGFGFGLYNLTNCMMYKNVDMQIKLFQHATS